MVRAVERKVRSRAQQIYVSRGQAEGTELQDWFQAEEEVLENKVLAAIYRRPSDGSEQNRKPAPATETSDQSATCETAV
ncbi:MAG: DUF2934 domain-containing protein [Candidatus Sulfotelmatobacter sp.]